jgi:hypothetical protein
MDGSRGLAPDSGKQTIELSLTEEQVAEIERLTGTRMTRLVVEAEPFDSPPLGTVVLGTIFTDPRSKVTARVNARFVE